jgi:hypothetical protein
MTFEGDEAVIAYIEQNRHLMDKTITNHKRMGILVFIQKGSIAMRINRRNDVLKLVDFYEKLFGVTAGEKSEYHSSVNIGGLLLTIDRADMEYVAIIRRSLSRKDVVLLC